MDQGQLRKYFIGDLSESDATAIEERSIADAGFEGDLLEAENVLIEDYLDGSLTDAEVSLFTSNYLITPDRRANIESTQRLREIARIKRHSDVQRPLDEPGSRTLAERIGSMFRSIPVPAYAAFALLIVAIIAGYLGLGRGSQLENLQAEYGPLNRSGHYDLSSVQGMDTFVLLPGSLRGSAIKIKTVGQQGERVLVRTALPIEFNTEKNFDVVFTRAGTTLLTLPMVPSVNVGAGQELRLILPKSLLTPGNYSLAAKPSGKSDDPITYEFTVE